MNFDITKEELKKCVEEVIKRSFDDDSNKEEMFMLFFTTIKEVNFHMKNDHSCLFCEIQTLADVPVSSNEIQVDGDAKEAAVEAFKEAAYNVFSHIMFHKGMEEKKRAVKKKFPNLLKGIKEVIERELEEDAEEEMKSAKPQGGLH